MTDALHPRQGRVCGRQRRERVARGMREVSTREVEVPGSFGGWWVFGDGSLKNRSGMDSTLGVGKKRRHGSG